MDTLLQKQTYILNDYKERPFYDRLHYQTIRLGDRINGIVGSRGTGKTTYLLNTVIAKGAYEKQALYVTADSLYFLDNSLFGLAESLYTQTDINYLCIDEIHKYKNWNQELKNIYDTFTKLKVLFSGSSMIDLIHSKYDLSRRVSLYPMYGFSFREYLEYYYEISIEPVKLDELIKHHVTISQSLGTTKIVKYFREYLRQGYYPFTKEIEYELDRFQNIENIVQKTIYEDIATLHNLKTTTLLVIEKLYKYILCSAAGELNTNVLASRLQKDFHDVSKYLSHLAQAGLINCLYPQKSSKAVLGAPAKILPENTNMIYSHYLTQSQDNIIGKIRETFAVNQFKNAGYQVCYSRIGDYKIDKYTFEIGGKNKAQKQLRGQSNAYVLADNITIGDKNTIPLYLVGLLY